VGWLETELVEACKFHNIIGKSPRMLEVLSQISRVAKHFQSLLITGPSGSGKELTARVLHRLSQRSHRPFIACNAAAIPDTLAESELFGYVRGAFTGAVKDKAGLFEYANGGTLFLDEVCELSLNVQVKLLRVLQEQEIQRVGSPATTKIDVKIIAATNRNPKEEIEAGRFRADLYYRLAMVEVELPPLRERREDLLLLQKYFVTQFATQYGKDIRGISRRAQNVLAAYDWPGNIRELENVIGRACMLADSPFIDLCHLPATLLERRQEPLSSSDALATLEQASATYARHVLATVGGNKRQAAEILGISRTTLYGLLKKADDCSSCREDGLVLGPHIQRRVG
jgi:transcriptional regulator with PAS, ATPase and Fis domain